MSMRKWEGNKRFFASIMPRMALVVVIALSSLVPAPTPAPAADDIVNIYSTRERGLIEPLLGVFENLTNIRPNLVNVSKDLVTRITREGKHSAADMILTRDLSELVAAKKAGITQPVFESFLRERMPVSYRDPSGHWFGLTKRARVVVVSKRRFSKLKALTYEELGDPEWKGRLCMREGSHTYNRGLFASLIAHMGAGWTERWLKDVKGNLAIRQTGGDREQIMFIKSGKCQIAIINSYYVGRMLTDKSRPKDRAAAQSIKLIFPNANDRGSHVSVSGMALLKNARNRNAALVLMDFLTSKPAQFIYAQDLSEYPIRDDVDPSPLVRSWGKLKAEKILLSDLVRHERKAVELLKKLNFDGAL